MKSIAIASLLLLGLFSIQSTPTHHYTEPGGITFFEGSWEDALKKAAEEDKMVFMDAYAVWCGPCKMLKRNVFSDQKIGSYFNENFINVAMDMERGEGRELARKYGVTAYPTLFFMDAEGKVQKKAVGYRNSAQLMELAQAVSPNTGS